SHPQFGCRTGTVGLHAGGTPQIRVSYEVPCRRFCTVGSKRAESEPGKRSAGGKTGESGAPPAGATRIGRAAEIRTRGLLMGARPLSLVARASCFADCATLREARSGRHDG